MTGLPVSGNEKLDAFATVTDKFSKTVRLIACHTTTTGKQFADLFKAQVARYHGLPDSILSDRDSRFTSAFWKQLTNVLQIEPRMGASHRPQTDGQSERSKETVEELLRIVSNMFSKDDWVSLLPDIEFLIIRCPQLFA